MWEGVIASFFFSHLLQVLYLSHLTTMGLKTFLVLVLGEEKGAEGLESSH